MSLLIVDDFDLKPLHPPADEDLHELMAERYESAATIVTSNLDLTEWDQAFPANKLLASATLDRMRHNAYCLVLDGHSYRAPRKLPQVMRQRLASEPKTARSLRPSMVPFNLVAAGSNMPEMGGSITPEGDSEGCAKKPNACLVDAVCHTGIALASGAEQFRCALVVLREEPLRLVQPALHDSIEYGAMLVEFAALLVGAACGELAVAVGLVVKLLAEAQQQPGTAALDQSEMKRAMQALPLRILFVAVFKQ